MRGNSGNLVAGRDMLDSLAERLAAEQINTGLLDALARKAESHGGVEPDLIDRFLQQELSHTLLLERSIRAFGGNPAVASDGARRVAGANAVLQRTVQDSSTSLRDALDALLVAESGDVLGWERLVQLAESSGFGALAWEFRGALLEEREQERTFREWRDRSPDHGERLARPA
jgi:hypothetical protein